MSRCLCVAAAALAACGTGSPWCGAADWPQMGGPNRDYVSPETGIARHWPEGGPRVLWTVALGAGYGAASVRDGEVYVLDREGEARDILRCFGLESGAELWQYAYDAPGSVSHDGSRTAPTIDEEHVYSVGLTGRMTCVDRKTHAPVWSRDLLADFGIELPGWGVAQAPSLYKDLVIVAPQARDAFVAAFRKHTGELVWKTASLGLVGYSTPVIRTLDGVDQAIMVSACAKDGSVTGKVAGIGLEDGALLWEYDGWHCSIPIPYVTALPGDRLFITGGYGAGSVMLQVKKWESGFVISELFKTDRCGSQIHQPLFFEDHLYVNSNSNEREDGMMCLAPDGEVKWKTRSDRSLPRFERGPLLLADGLIFNLDGRTGVLHLVEPSPDGYKELARAEVLGGKEIWAPMALSGGRLIIRSQSEMKCLDVRTP